MKPLPIQWKFALWTVTLVAVAVLVFSGGTLINLYSEQIEAIDLELKTDAKHLAELDDPKNVDEMVAEFVRDQPLLAFAFFDKAGRLQKSPKRLPEKFMRTVLGTADLQTIRSKDGSWRLGAFKQPAGTQFVAAYSLDDLEDNFGDILLAFSLTLPVVLIFAALGGWWVAGRALAPIRNLTRVAENMGPEQLDQRVPVTIANDELDRLAKVFNDMLTRLEMSFKQTQRFAADASHELRTPLTIMRGEIEQLLRQPGILPNHEAILLSLQEEIDRLDRITENLLLLTHLDAGNAVMDRDAVNLSALVTDACEDAEILGASRQIRVETRVGHNINVIGDAAHLRRVLLNLLDNSTKFNVAGGVTQCFLTNLNNRAIVQVRNTGSGIPLELRARVFERFFRAEPSRNGEKPGHGLGLSLSREIARAHGGELQLIDVDEAGWTEFRLYLPLN